MIELCSGPFDRWHDKPQCFRILPRLAQFRNWHLLRSTAV